MKTLNKMPLIFAIIILFCSGVSLTQEIIASELSDSHILRIKAAAGPPKILEGHLKMGTPTGPDGISYGVNSLYFTRNGEPWLPVMGEIHYARVGGRGGEPYILKCKQIALELGMDVPYYSVTGWGGAWVPQDEVLPVQGSYVDPFWAAGTEQLPPFDELLFSDLISLVINTNVASDIVTDRIKQQRWRYDPSRYPFATAELGGGMHHKILRRPILDSRDTEAMALCRLGEGANMLGYYMYHGGSQPLGRTGRLVEGDMPLVSYDFQAPLQEFGKTNASYYALKHLHQFIQDFGRELAQMTPTLPKERPEAADPGKLRYALRSKGNRGFLFFNNHQRYLKMPAREDIKFAVTLDDRELVFPDKPVTIPSKSVGIFPINLPIADATLTYATAQPLMRWQDGDITRLVMTRLPGIETQLNITGVNEPPGETGRISRMVTRNEAKVEILLLSEQESLNAWKINIAGKRYLAICPIELWQSGDSLKFRTRRSDSANLSIYPATDQALIYEGKQINPQKEGDFSLYSLPEQKLPQISVTSQANAEVPPADKDYPFVKADAPPKAWRIRIGEIDWNAVSDVMVNFEYIGDMARLYLNGRLVADNFWSKPNWEVGLKRWQKELAKPDSELILVISPWKKDQEVFVQKRPNVTEDLTAKLIGIKTSAERSFTLEIK